MNEVRSLPFVRSSDEYIASYWQPERSGDYARDCATGRAYADELMRFLRESGRVQVLPWIVQALPEREYFSGVEIGFMTRIADALRVTPA